MKLRSNQASCIYIRVRYASLNVDLDNNTSFKVDYLVGFLSKNALLGRVCDTQVCLCFNW